VPCGQLHGLNQNERRRTKGKTDVLNLWLLVTTAASLPSLLGEPMTLSKEFC